MGCEAGACTYISMLWSFALSAASRTTRSDGPAPSPDSGSGRPPRNLPVCEEEFATNISLSFAGVAGPASMLSPPDGNGSSDRRSWA